MGLLDLDEETAFVQTIVYWPPAGVDAGGQPKWSAPSEIKGRWEDDHHESLGDMDETLDAGARVLVASDVAEKGALLLGSLTSTMAGSTDPRAFGGREIIRVTKMPDREDEASLRTAFLAR